MMWKIRMMWNQRGERFAWWVARLIPRRIALYTFVRVCAATGEGPGDVTYESAYKAWESGAGK